MILMEGAVLAMNLNKKGEDVKNRRVVHFFSDLFPEYVFKKIEIVSSYRYDPLLS